MTSLLTGAALCAVLFIIYGIVGPRVGCNGSGCAGCGGACHRADDLSAEDHQ